MKVLTACFPTEIVQTSAERVMWGKKRCWRLKRAKIGAVTIFAGEHQLTSSQSNSELRLGGLLTR